MSKKVRKILLQADRFLDRAVQILALLLFILLFIWVVCILLAGFGIISIIGLFWEIYAYFSVLLLCLFFIISVLHCSLMLFVKEESESQEDILRHQTIVTRLGNSLAPISSPLLNLQAQEERCVCDLLKRLPAHANKSDYINLAQVAQFLTALKQLGYLDDADRHNLLRWVEQTSGKKTPPLRQFNEAYPSSTISKVSKAKANIEESLRKLR